MFASLLEEVHSLARLYRKRRAEVARSEKISRARWDVLSAATEGRTVAQIARSLGTARQNVQRVTDALAVARLVRFEANPNHRRSPRIQLTQEGSVLRERLERKLRGWEQPGEDLVEKEDVDTALVVLRALRASLER
jgi:DNA-binding MarR family transcriptional regulator